MEFIYIGLAYFVGVISVWLVLYATIWLNDTQKGEKSPPIEEEENVHEEIIQAAQFIDPDPLEDRLKDGTELKEIIQ